MAGWRQKRLQQQRPEAAGSAGWRSRQKLGRQLKRAIAGLLCLWVCVLILYGQSPVQGQQPSHSTAPNLEPSGSLRDSVELKSEVPASWPALRAHTLPDPLSNWEDETSSGDYFDQIQPTKVGYLVWSEFPLRIYIEPYVSSPGDGSPIDESLNSSSSDRSESSAELEAAKAWFQAVSIAVEDWETYIPLQVVAQPDQAHIQIQRSRPPLRVSEGQFRSRSATTQYKLYRHRQSVDEAQTILTHRCTILIRPGLSPRQTQAAARHELGHALGLWGHSPTETDALYFSQVQEPPAVSVRDVNTLKRVYQQPTRLGWAFRSRT